MSDKQIPPDLKQKIDAMTQEEMAAHWRFAPAGDPLHCGDVGTYFETRFKELGGMTTEISKKIGW